MTTIAETLAKSHETSRAAFVAAIWSGQPLETLAQLAAAAGLPATDADALRNRLLALMARIPLAEKFGEREAALNRAQRTFDAKSVGIRAKIDALETELAGLAYTINDAQRSLGEAEAARRELLQAELVGLKPRGQLARDYDDRQADEQRRTSLRLRFDRLRRAHADSLDHAERIEQMQEKYKKLGADRCSEFLIGNFAAGEISFKDLPGQAEAARANAENALKGLRLARSECVAAGIVLPPADDAERGTKKAGA